MNGNHAGHWDEIAAQWDHVGPPLRPSDQDLDFVRGRLEAWTKIHGPPRVLILGVTPELFRLTSSRGFNILACDQSVPMIQQVWPGVLSPAVCADWRRLPLKSDSRDIVFCDGGLHLVKYPEGHQWVVQSLRSIVVRGGLCILRLFVPPRNRERPEDIVQDLKRGKIASMNILKIRLGMALQESAGQGVRLGRVWEILHEVVPDLQELAARTGWPLADVLAVNTYKNCDACYCYVRVEEVLRMFCEEPGGFEALAVETPGYALGERFPTVVLRRTSS